MAFQFTTYNGVAVADLPAATNTTDATLVGVQEGETRKFDMDLITSQFSGWSPVMAYESRSTDIVAKIIDWQGGTGTKPPVNVYITATGVDADINNGVNVRGIQGMPGTNGAKGDKGDSGQASVSNIAALKAFPTGSSTQLFLEDGEREGQFIRRTGVPPYADPENGIFVISDTPGFYWERIHDRVWQIEWFGGAADSDGSVGNGTDNAVAANAALLLGKQFGGVTIRPQFGIYRTTAPIQQIDSGVSFKIQGEGSGQTFFLGDFVGAGDGIFDLSNTNADSYSTTAIHFGGIGFLGRGTAGDPVGLKAENAFEIHIDDVDAPYKDGRALANSAILTTNGNNIKINNLRGQAGFQPLVYDTTGLTASCDGSDVITFSGAFAKDIHAGQKIYFNSGSDTETNKIWHATILATGLTPTAALTCTIDKPAPSTTAGMKFVVGEVRAALTAGNNVIQMNNFGGANADYVGMQIHIEGGIAKSDAAGKIGVLSTKITAATATTITLQDAPSETVSDALVYFCPGGFCGSFEGDPVARQANHVWLDNVHMEGFQACAFLFNRVTYVEVKNLKAHGPNYATAPDWGQCYRLIVASEVKTLKFIGSSQCAYGILDERIHISGSRGVVNLDQIEVGHITKDLPYVLLEEVTSDFRLLGGAFVFQYSLAGFADDYQLISAPFDANVDGVAIIRRSNKDGTMVMSSACFNKGATATYKQIRIDDDKVLVIENPPGNFGLMHMASSDADTSAILHYRLSDHANGSIADLIAAGADVAKFNSTDLTDGSGDGAVDKTSISPDSQGNIRVKNRENKTIYYAFYFTAFGYD